MVGLIHSWDNASGIFNIPFEGTEADRSGESRVEQSGVG